MNPIDFWENEKKLGQQVFDIVQDGKITLTEVNQMTNQQRRRWIGRMNERAKKQKADADRAKNKKGGGPRPSRFR